MKIIQFLAAIAVMFFWTIGLHASEKVAEPMAAKPPKGAASKAAAQPVESTSKFPDRLLISSTRSVHRLYLNENDGKSGNAPILGQFWRESLLDGNEVSQLLTAAINPPLASRQMIIHLITSYFQFSPPPPPLPHCRLSHHHTQRIRARVTDFIAPPTSQRQFLTGANHHLSFNLDAQRTAWQINWCKGPTQQTFRSNEPFLELFETPTKLVVVSTATGVEPDSTNVRLFDSQFNVHTVTISRPLRHTACTLVPRRPSYYANTRGTFLYTVETVKRTSWHDPESGTTYYNQHRRPASSDVIAQVSLATGRVVHIPLRNARGLVYNTPVLDHVLATASFGDTLFVARYGRPYVIHVLDMNSGAFLSTALDMSAFAPLPDPRILETFFVGYDEARRTYAVAALHALTTQVYSADACAELLPYDLLLLDLQTAPAPSLWTTVASWIPFF